VPAKRTVSLTIDVDKLLRVSGSDNHIGREELLYMIQQTISQVSNALTVEDLSSQGFAFEAPLNCQADTTETKVVGKMLFNIG
jgi:hypothetical protein